MCMTTEIQTESAMRYHYSIENFCFLVLISPLANGFWLIWLFVFLMTCAVRFDEIDFAKLFVTHCHYFEDAMTSVSGAMSRDLANQWPRSSDSSVVCCCVWEVILYCRHNKDSQSGDARNTQQPTTAFQSAAIPSNCVYDLTARYRPETERHVTSRAEAGIERHDSVDDRFVLQQHLQQLLQSAAVKFCQHRAVTSQLLLVLLHALD